MPLAIRVVTYVLPARYAVALLQTIYLAGDVGSVIWFNLAILTAMATALMIATRLATRKQLSFDQLLVTPFRPSEIMVGKAVPNMVIGLGQSTTILLMAQFWFHIPFEGSFELAAG